MTNQGSDMSPFSPRILEKVRKVRPELEVLPVTPPTIYKGVNGKVCAVRDKRVMLNIYLKIGIAWPSY